MKQRTPKPRRFGPAHPGTAGLRSAEVGTSHRGRPWRRDDRDENPLEASGIGYEGDDANLGIERAFPFLACTEHATSLFPFLRGLNFRCRQGISFPCRLTPVSERPSGQPGSGVLAAACYWIAKIGYNRDRDRRTNALLAGLGWQVLRLCEMDVLKDPQRAAHQVAALVGVSPRPTSGCGSGSHARTGRR